MTGGTSTGGVVTVGGVGSGASGSGVVGTGTGMVGSGLGAAGAGADAGGVDDDAFESGVCADRTGAGAARFVGVPAVVGCAATRPSPFGRPASLRLAFDARRAAYVAPPCGYAPTAASLLRSTTVGLECLWPTPNEANGDGAMPSTTITAKSSNVAPAAQIQSRTSSRRDACTLMLPLSG
jgi:hypothetical protein